MLWKFLLLGSAWLFPVLALAAREGYAPLAPLPGVVETVTSGGSGLSGYIQAMFEFALGMSGVIGVLVLVVAGVQYVASFSSESLKKDAKERMTNVAWGFGLLASAWLILYVVNPDLLQTGFTLPPSQSEFTEVSGRVSVIRGGASGDGGAGYGREGTIKEGDIVLPQPFRPSDPPPPPPPPVLSDKTNDHAIVFDCAFTGVSDSLCGKADFTGDGAIDTKDYSAFSVVKRFDMNGSGTVEKKSSPRPASCFFKVNTGSIPTPPIVIGVDHSALSFPLPDHNHGSSVQDSSFGHRHVSWDNGVPFFSTECADIKEGGTVFSIPQFEIVRNTLASSGIAGAIKLESLHKRLFECTEDRQGFSCGATIEIPLKNIIFSSLALLDMNGDGVANLQKEGADVLRARQCIGKGPSGECARADMNGDGAIKESDFALISFLEDNVVNGISFFPLNFFIRDMEAEFFDAAGYEDGQILEFCFGRKSGRGCAPAQLDNTDKANVVNDADRARFNDAFVRYDINGDGILNTR